MVLVSGNGNGGLRRVLGWLTVRVEEEEGMARRVFGVECGGLSRQAVLLVFVAVAAGFGVASGASAAAEPSEGVRGAEVGCSRPLVDVVWGFLLTLLALSVSLWGSTKHRSDNRLGKLRVLLVGVFAPLIDLSKVFVYSWICVVMVWSCERLEDGAMRFPSSKWFRIVCSLLNPWSQSPARILTGCDIILYVRKNRSEGSEESLNRKPDLLQESWLWEKVDVEVEREAMVIGDDLAKSGGIMEYDKRQLSIDGKAALLWGEFFSKHDEYRILPGYHQLKFLRGNSGFAVIAIAIQAIGYIYAVIFRSMKDLRVAPIEVIGLVFNIILLVKASLYSTSNPCNRPLVIYMDEEREKRLISVLSLKERASFQINEGFWVNLALGSFVIIGFCLYIPIIYYIVTLMKGTSIMIVMPLIIFAVGLLADLTLCFAIAYEIPDDVSTVAFILALVLNAVAYGWAMVVTLHSWKSQHFNTRPELVDLSQIIPFIG